MSCLNPFEELYLLYFDDVYRFLLRLTGNQELAEELTAETFFKALKSVEQFRDECSVRVWLCQIAKNSYYTHLRKQKRLTDSSALDTLTDSDNTLERLTDQEDVEQIQQALDALPPPYQEVFRLRVYGELPFRKIGRRFGKSEHWACVTYHRAKEKIQDAIGGINDE